MPIKKENLENGVTHDFQMLFEILEDVLSVREFVPEQSQLNNWGFKSLTAFNKVKRGHKNPTLYQSYKMYLFLVQYIPTLDFKDVIKEQCDEEYSE